MNHVNITISGDVQGVGFRYAAKKTANSYRIKGFVKNLSNGNVYVEAEGNEKNVNQFIKWLHQGPSHARVKNVDAEQAEPVHYQSFDIR